MKPLIKFKIGEEYELYEFLLEYHSCFKNQQGYEYMVYKYLGNDVKDILGYEIKQPILLAYNADILSHIIISVSQKTLFKIKLKLILRGYRTPKDSIVNHLKERLMKKNIVHDFYLSLNQSKILMCEYKHIVDLENTSLIDRNSF